MIKAETKISEVTVFTDRALITRTLLQHFKKGEYSLLFCTLPNNVSENTIQAIGKGDAILHDVKIQTVVEAENQDKKQNDLLNKLDKNNLEISKKEIIRNSLEKEKEVLAQIIKKVTKPTDNIELDELQPKNWLDILKFNRTRNDEIVTETLSLQNSIKKIETENSQINEQLKKLDKPTSTEYKQVIINIEVIEDSDIYLELSYIVLGPSWTAKYDLRFNSEKNIMQLDYHALIKQNTSENWTDTKIQLSTAQIQTFVSTRTPEITDPTPLLAIFDYKKKFTDRFKRKDIEFDWILIFPELAGFEDDFIEEPVNNNLNYNDANTLHSSIEFEIRTKNTILCDNNSHKILFKTIEVPLKYKFLSVPQEIEKVYLNAEILNNSKFPFLKGEISIFMDNSFIYKSNLPFDIIPSKEFTLNLGVDETVKVSYENISSNDISSSGLIQKRKSKIFEYLITIDNLKDIDIDIEIQEHLPVARDKEINIHLLEPKYEKDIPELKKTAIGLLEFKRKIKAKTKSEFTVKYDIEYPSNWKINVPD